MIDMLSFASNALPQSTWDKQANPYTKLVWFWPQKWQQSETVRTLCFWPEHNSLHVSAFFLGVECKTEKLTGSLEVNLKLDWIVLSNYSWFFSLLISDLTSVFFWRSCGQKKVTSLQNWGKIYNSENKFDTVVESLSQLQKHLHWSLG